MSRAKACSYKVRFDACAFDLFSSAARTGSGLGRPRLTRWRRRSLPTWGWTSTYHFDRVIFFPRSVPPTRGLKAPQRVTQRVVVMLRVSWPPTLRFPLHPPTLALSHRSPPNSRPLGVAVRRSQPSGPLRRGVVHRSEKQPQAFLARSLRQVFPRCQGSAWGSRFDCLPACACFARCGPIFLTLILGRCFGYRCRQDLSLLRQHQSSFLETGRKWQAGLQGGSAPLS